MELSELWSITCICRMRWGHWKSAPLLGAPPVLDGRLHLVRDTVLRNIQDSGPITLNDGAALQAPPGDEGVPGDGAVLSVGPPFLAPLSLPQIPMTPWRMADAPRVAKHPT